MVSEVDSDDIVVVGEEAMDLLPWQRWWWRVLVCRIGVDKKRSGKHAATIRQLECGHGAREFVLLDYLMWALLPPMTVGRPLGKHNFLEKQHS